jgi:hypothetical protein
MIMDMTNIERFLLRYEESIVAMVFAAEKLKEGGFKDFGDAVKDMNTKKRELLAQIEASCEQDKVLNPSEFNPKVDKY